MRCVPVAVQVERVLRPRFADVAGAQQALAAMRRAFPTGPGKGQGRAGVVEEFKALLQRGEWPLSQLAGSYRQPVFLCSSSSFCGPFSPASTEMNSPEPMQATSPAPLTLPGSRSSS